MADINLLPQEEKASERVLKLQKNLSIVSFALLILVAIGTVITLVMFTIFASDRNNLNSQIADSTKRIDASREKEELLTVVKKKATAVDKLESTRLDQTKIFNALAELTPNDVYFSGISVKDNKVVVSGKARTSVDMAGFVSSIVNPPGTKYFTAVNLGALSSDAKGEYSFSMEAEIINSPDTQTD